MQDKSTFLLAADSEAEMEEWISTLNKILHSSFEQAMQEKRNGELHDGVCLCIVLFMSLTFVLSVLAAQLFLHVFICLPYGVCLCFHLFVSMSFDGCCTLQFVCSPWNNLSLH